MTIENKKVDIINWLSSLEDEKPIDKLYVLKGQYADEWYFLLSSNEKKSIQNALYELSSGKAYSHNEVKDAVKSKISQLNTE